MPTTARLGLPYPTAASSANVPADIQALATALDQAGLWGQGLLAARPAAVGIQGRFYWATDSALLYINTGTAWVAIGPAGLGADSITTAMIQALAVTTAKLADGSVTTGKINDAAVTLAKLASASVDASKIAAALKPSGGAGAGTEALRALGTAAGEALPGTHAGVEAVKWAGAYSAASENPGGADETWVDLSGNCQITIPTAGEWLVTFGFRSIGDPSGSNSEVGLSLNNAAPFRTIPFNNTAVGGLSSQHKGTFALNDTLRFKFRDNDVQLGRRLSTADRFINAIKVY